MTSLRKNKNIENVAQLDGAYDARYEIYTPDATSALRHLYGDKESFPEILARIMRIVRDAYLQRPEALKELDLRRSQRPDWFQQPDRIGYTAYVDRFAGTLKGVEQKISYLKELGVSYLHLLPLLKMRSGDNDGGFAVSSYTEVEPALGSMTDLSNLAERLRESDISLCVDFVLNHTAEDHQWAQRARAGDEHFKGFYYFYPDRELPDQYERALGDIFADTAPGNFTFIPERNEWVWTTFYPYQWDLNYSNPLVFEEMLKSILFLANKGIDVFRLDAAPYLWKRLGTNCLNQPEVFSIIRALRALTAIASPGVLLKAEAIVPSYKLVQYLGAGKHAGKECQLAYNTTLMTMIWSALAEGRAARLVSVLKSTPPLSSGASWLNYVRCHDDIGWGVLLEEKAGYGKREWRDHANFARAFYAGDADGSFADGENYQSHSTAGSTASLCGLEQAQQQGDGEAIELAIKRILLLYTVVFSYGGIPLISMGDELGQVNDHDYATKNRYDGDGRWLHRGAMDWQKAQKRHGSDIEARIFSEIRKLAAIRSNTPQLMQSTAGPGLCGNDRVLTLHHHNAHGELFVCVNFSSEPAWVTVPPAHRWRDQLTGEILNASQIELGAYGRLWLTPAGQAK